MKEIRIGYQGIEFSNNHAAAIQLAEKQGLAAERLRLIPLVSSSGVVAALTQLETDYGVMAVSTDAGGMVAETQEAILGKPLDMIETVSIDIHHCLFKKSDEVPDSSIRTIASHPEALKECIRTVSRLFPDAQMLAAQDTALAARQLHLGTLPDDTAVLCSLEAGTAEGLVLLQANIEDMHPNGTCFGLFRVKSEI